MAPWEMCRWGLDYPSCTLEGTNQKCVRIKIHALNNTSNTSIVFSDAYYVELLNEINKAYKDSKIQFTFGEECINRFTLLLNPLHENVANQPNTAQKIRQLLADSEGEPLPPVPSGQSWVFGLYRHPDLGYVENYINL